MVRWFGGSVVRWYGGTEVRRYGGTAVRRYAGTEEQWYKSTKARTLVAATVKERVTVEPSYTVLLATRCRYNTCRFGVFIFCDIH